MKKSKRSFNELLRDKESGIDSSQWDNRYRAVFTLPFGKYRRERLLELLGPDQNQMSTIKGFLVNTRHCPVLDKDPDLKHLVKTGKVKQVRVHINRTRARTYLQLA